MLFKDINWQEADQNAYINTKVLYDKFRHLFDELYGFQNSKQDLILYQIYKIFSYFQDKGTSYTNITINNNQLILFKDKSFGNPGNIKITLYRNFLQIESSLTKYTGDRNFIRIIINPQEIYINGFIKEENKPAITIKGIKNKNKDLTIEVTEPNQRNIIQNDEPWHIFSVLIENILDDKYFNNLSSTTPTNIWKKLSSTLYQKGLSHYQEEFFTLLHKCLQDNIDISYYQEELSTFFITRNITEYLNNLPYNNNIKLTQIPIKGLNINEESIQKFLNYEITDEYNRKYKLTDIPLSLVDTTNISKCQFLDILNNLREDEIDIYIVGLAYFATYCTSFGELSGHNFYGSNIYPKYAGYKMNVAIKSSLLGIPLVDYARARYQKNGENYPQICHFFKILGFDFKKGERNNQLLESEQNSIDVYRFKKLINNGKHNPFSLS